MKPAYEQIENGGRWIADLAIDTVKFAFVSFVTVFALWAFGLLQVQAGGPSCCAQRNLLAAGALGAVNEIGPGDNVTRYARDARMRLEKALEYSVGPCRWEGGQYVCDGAR